MARKKHLWLRPTKKPVGEKSSRSFAGSNNYFGNYTSPITHGGVFNPQTGMGGPTDHSNQTLFHPTRIYTRDQLEILRVESWAAKAFIEMPVDDMLIRWRTFDETDSNSELMMEQEKRFDVQKNLTNAMKAGRLYGTGLMAVMSTEAPLTNPFNIEQFRPGDLSTLLVFNRYDATVIERDYNIFSPEFGKAVIYHIAPKYGMAFDIHASRVLTFNGIEALSNDGFSWYERDWGVSSIVPALDAIHQDASIAAVVSHLAQEASIPVIKVSGIREALAGEMYDEHASSANQIAYDINANKSIYRMMMMDTEDNFERLQVTWLGLPELMDRFYKRLAAVAGIPETRFLGASPSGFNSTGESDLQHYAMHVAAMQNRMLPAPLTRLDMVLASDAGILDVPTYTFNPLLDLSEEMHVMLEKNRSDRILAEVTAGVISIEEAREQLGYMNNGGF